MIEGDLHIHSFYSNGYFRNLPPWVASSPEKILAQAKKVGLKVVAIADHDSLEGFRQAERLAPEFGLIVVPACEITTQEGHLLAYGIKKEIPKNLTARQTIKLIHKQGGLAVAAHPFRVRPPIFNGIGLNKLINSLPLDGLEVANAGMNLATNRQALLATQKQPFKLAKIGGSDSHVLDFIGYGRTFFKNEVKNADDVLAAIKKKQTEAEVIQLVSDWQKFWASFRDQFKFVLLFLNR